jgi:hypothetical protein
MLFFKKGIEAEQGTQKTPKTGKRKSKNDHASAVRVQKLLNRPFFTRGQTLDNLPGLQSDITKSGSYPQKFPRC